MPDVDVVPPPPVDVAAPPLPEEAVEDAPVGEPLPWFEQLTMADRTAANTVGEDLENTPLERQSQRS